MWTCRTKLCGKHGHSYDTCSGCQWCAGMVSIAIKLLPAESNGLSFTESIDDHLDAARSVNELITRQICTAEPCTLMSVHATAGPT
jgi:hypothetical protein